MIDKANSSNRQISTIMGLLAILFWSTSIAFTRSLTEKTGILNTAFFNLLFSGIFLILVQILIFRKRFFTMLRGLRLSYIYKVGTFMVIYNVLYYYAIGGVDTRAEVLVVGIINYLWPGLAFLFSIPILGNKARYGWLVLGLAVSFAGIVAAVMEGSQLSLSDMTSALLGRTVPYIFALIAALAWGIYSNITRKYQTDAGAVAIPVFFLISAMVILIVQVIQGEMPELTLTSVQYWEFAYFVIFPTALSYLFWDYAMKGGNKNLLVGVSYIIPLVSTIISGLYLEVTISIWFALAAVMVILGAVLCRWSIEEKSDTK